MLCDNIIGVVIPRDHVWCWHINRRLNRRNIMILSTLAVKYSCRIERVRASLRARAVFFAQITPIICIIIILRQSISNTT